MLVLVGIYLLQPGLANFDIIGFLLYANAAAIEFSRYSTSRAATGKGIQY